MKTFKEYTNEAKKSKGVQGITYDHDIALGEVRNYLRGKNPTKSDIEKEAKKEAKKRGLFEDKLIAYCLQELKYEDTNESNVTEAKTLTIYDKITLRKTLQKEKSGWLSIDKETGRWNIEDKEPKDNFKEVHSVQDIRNYYGWRYNVGTSISVAFKDLEAGRWDQSEVGR